ncbi:MAG: choice-of-anchor R domain-containing protein, partial [Limisphaerales bacterium]
AAGSSAFTMAKGVSKIMVWTKIKTAAAVVTVGLLGVGGISTATWFTFFKPRIVFSSFGPTGEYNKRVSWFVGVGKPYKNDSGYRGQAEWFSLDISGGLKTIEVALHSGRRKGGALNVSITEDENGIPGKVLEHFSVLQSDLGKGSALVLKSRAKPKLQAGQKYWLCAEPADPLSQWSWSYNSQKLARGFAYEREQGKWESFKGGPNNGAFSVAVSP